MLKQMATKSDLLPFGVREAQQLEREGYRSFYNHVYPTSVTPNIKKVGRKLLLTYSVYSLPAYSKQFSFLKFICTVHL